MSATELKYRRRNRRLTDADTYDARCGEVFITLNRILFFHCSLCDGKYASFDSFFEHLLKHYEKIQNERTKIVAENYEIKIETQYSLDNCIREPSDQVTDFDRVNHDQSSDNCSFVEDVVQTELIDIGELTNANPTVSGALDEAPCDYNQLQTDEEDNSTKINFFHCEQCNKLFNTKAHLTRHNLTHSDERKHKCSICGAAFKEKSNFNAHVRRHSDYKKVGCELCTKRFYTRTEKVLHMRSHTREKPYICPHCGISFTTSSSLTKHTKRHTEEPDFRCSYCNKGCWRKEQLEDHLLVHTKEKPFTCPVCNAKYPRRKSWLRHMKLHEKSCKPILIGHE